MAFRGAGRCAVVVAAAHAAAHTAAHTAARVKDRVGAPQLALGLSAARAAATRATRATRATPPPAAARRRHQTPFRCLLHLAAPRNPRTRRRRQPRPRERGRVALARQWHRMETSLEARVRRGAPLCLQAELLRRSHWRSVVIIGLPYMGELLWRSVVRIGRWPRAGEWAPLWPVVVIRPAVIRLAVVIIVAVHHVPFPFGAKVSDLSDLSAVEASTRQPPLVLLFVIVVAATSAERHNGAREAWEVRRGGQTKGGEMGRACHGK